MNKRIIDLGCGLHKQKDAIGIDNMDLEGVDIVADIKKGIPMEDLSCDEVIMSHFFEHLNEDERLNLMKEIYRVLKVGGVVKITCPHSYAFYGYADPTHKAMDKITLTMFDYYEESHPMHVQYFNFSFNIIKKKIRNVVISFPFRSIKQGYAEHRIWWLGIHFTIDKVINFLVNRWEPVIKFIPVQQAELYIELKRCDNTE